MFLFVRSKQPHWQRGYGMLWAGGTPLSFLGSLIPAGSQWLHDQTSGSPDRQGNGDGNSLKMRGLPVFMEF